MAKKLDYRFLKTATNSGLEDDGAHGIRIQVQSGGGLILDSTGLSLDRSTIDEMYIAEYTIQAADMTSKSFTLTQAMADTDQFSLLVYGGPPQNYGVDFTASSSTVITWNGLGLDGTISEGDEVQVSYPI